jgi:hypothetical protein
VTFETDCKTIVERALAQNLGHTGETTWLPSPGAGSLAVRVAGRGGRSVELTASRTRLEARLSRPARTATLTGDYEDTDLLARDADRIARFVDRYLRGQGRLQREQGALGVRRSLVVTTTDGEWKVGPRTTQVPESA